MRRTVTAVSLLFDDGSVAKFEGVEKGLYIQTDSWREGEIKGLAIEKWISHEVQWTTDRVKVESENVERQS